MKMNMPQCNPLSTEQHEHLQRELPLHYELWVRCDGQRDVHALALELALPSAQVWLMLDELADLHALKARVAPPISQIPALGSSMSRRQAIVRLGVGALGAGVAMRTLGSSLVYAQDDAKSAALVESSVADMEVAKKRLEERDAKAQEAKRNVDEATAKRKEFDRCQETHKKSGARQPPSQCADSTRVREAERKSNQQLKKVGQDEQGAKAQVKQAQKRHIEAREKHSSESSTKGKKKLDERTKKIKQPDRTTEASQKDK